MTESYTVAASGDSLANIASMLASAVNSDPLLSSPTTGIGVTATQVGQAIVLHSVSQSYTSYSHSVTGAETVNIFSNPNSLATITNNGTNGSTITITTYNSALTGGSYDFVYPVSGTPSPQAMASAISGLMNLDTTLTGIGIITTFKNNQITISSSSTNPTSYGSSTSAGATEQLAIAINGVQANLFQYNPAGLRTQAIDPAGRIFNYLYAANNVDLLEVRESQDGDNFLQGKWQYNNQHLPTSYIEGSGQKTQYLYFSNGQINTVTDPLGNVWTFTYNASKYLTQIDGPLPGSADITTFTYDSYGRIATKTDSEGYTTTYSYDAGERLTQISYPDGSNKQITYNRLDAVLMKDRIGRITTFNYDSLDQIASSVDPLNRITAYSWCSCGSLSSLTDPAGNVTQWSHDLEGRVTTKTYADTSTVTYGYDTGWALNNQIRCAWSNNQLHFQSR